MRNAKWVVFAVALGMMAATAGWLQKFRQQPRLGPPGVRVSQVPIYDDKNKLAANQSIVLPASVLGIPALPIRYSPITTDELDALPKDTTFGRRYYLDTNNNFGVQISVVLMGTDHTSIHQPQYCLYAQDWTIINTERINVPMAPPFASIPAVKMTGKRQMRDGRIVDCLYVYWFVSGDKMTSEEGSRLLSMWKTVLEKGEMERWAYISYFATCHPGDEQATFERLEKIIQASAPQFQLVTGNPPGRLSPVTAQK
jgi:hypothetical protein